VRVEPWATVIHFSRSGGPGGQNVNKVNTKATLWLDPAGLTNISDAARARLMKLAANRMTVDGRIQLIAETRRPQEGNRAAVLEKLDQLFLAALKEPKVRRKTRPSAASKRRRVEAKRHRGEIKARRRGLE